MAITLSKGKPLSLTKAAPGIRKALIGLGWDARTTTGHAFDLDASAVLIAANGRVRSDADFIFYGQKADAAGSVIHQGDNLTGDGDGDDEQIIIDLTLVPSDIVRIAIVVSIHEAAERNQTFGQVRNAYVRVVNDGTGHEVARYDLAEERATENAVLFAELTRDGGEWSVNALGLGFSEGLGGIARSFGVNIG